ncbi:hypothetical protein B0A49_03127 [Cryomyces minteri]|uniref:Uncharacterized protein n=1 Tax=Cryomyces minteri TaxID=331657 RepID=A0A4U0XCT4_9PEZI|nr:hypothetical protein B0A49_03127 [Cryomyces minteri]
MASDSDTVSTISLYAELLFHIRAVSFIASLQTNSSKTTRAELSADGEHINLTHDGEVATIRLPTKIAGGGSAVLTLPAVPSKELTLRLQLEERGPGLLRIDGGSADVVPWSNAHKAAPLPLSIRRSEHQSVLITKTFTSHNQLSKPLSTGLPPAYIAIPTYIHLISSKDYASITMSLNIKKLLAWIQKHAEQNVRVRASDPAKERLHAWRNSYVYGMP